MGIIDRLLSVQTSAPRAGTTTLRSPATWFLEALGRRESASGVHVSEAVALGLSPYYCGVNMIAGTIGSLPLNVYKRDGKKRDVWDRSPAHWLLHNEPNPHMTAMSLRQTWVMHALARGNAYGEIVWDSRGEPFEIWPLLPHQTTPRLDDQNALWYEVRIDDGEVRYLPAENVLHIPGLGYDGIMGYGLLKVARESIGLNAAQDQYAGRFFRNGGNISGAIETEQTLREDQFNRLKSEVAQKLSGLTNAHRIAIFEAGMKFKPMNPTHEEAQLIEARRFTVEEWARWLNMPPHKLREMTHATFSNIEHQNIEWVVDTIRPWLVRFEQEYNRKLFTKQTLFYTKHVVEGLLRGDLKTRYEAYAVARGWGWMSANDVLELEDRNPLPGKLGDIYLTPLNMIPADQAGQQATRQAPPEPSQAAAQRRAAAERVVTFAERSANGDVVARAREWLGIDETTARHFAGLSKHLDLLAAENDVSREELHAAKVGVLVGLTIGEAQ